MPIKEGYTNISREECNPLHGLYYGFEIFLLNLDATVIVNQGNDKFWRSICRNLRISRSTRFPFRDEQIADVMTFKNFFAKANLPDPRPVILLIDEASRLVQANGSMNGVQEIVNEFLSTLKVLQEDHTNHCIYSVALFGTESVKDLIVHESPNRPLSISPFSYDNCWKCGRFIKSDVTGLLAQFSETVSRELDIAEIASDIFELTLGHRGLTGACCRFIEMTFKVGPLPIVSIDDWKKQTIVNLKGYIQGMDTYRSIIQRFPMLSNSQRFMFSIVLRFGDHQASPVS